MFSVPAKHLDDDLASSFYAIRVCHGMDIVAIQFR